MQETNYENEDFLEENNHEQLIVLNPSEAKLEMRLDVFLASELGITRNYAQKLISSGNIRITDSPRKVKPALKLSGDIEISVCLPPVEKLEVEPEPVSFDTIYEDKDILVINKPSGVVVHPAPGNWHGTLVHGLLYKYPDIGKFGDTTRPGIVHRLDEGTSGLIVVARNEKALLNLQHQFHSREVKKVYLALAIGKPSSISGFINAPIGRSVRNRTKMAIISNGRPAITEYKVLWTHKGLSLIQCHLLTGRTHQIRVHLKAIGCPLVGDTLYGTKQSLKRKAERIFLHAWQLAFAHPSSGEKLFFRVTLPQELRLFLQKTLSSPLDLP